MNDDICKVFKKSLGDYRIYGMDIMLAFALVTLSCLLVLLLPSLPLFYVALIYFCIGISKFGLMILRSKKVQYESLFSNWQTLLTSFLSKSLSFIISALWLLLLIVPGIISLLNFSFVSFVIADGETSSAKALATSKKLVYGRRFDILLVCLLAIFLICLSLCGAFGIAILVSLLVPLALWLKITIAVALALLPAYLLILPFAHICIANLYLASKQRTASEKKVKTIATSAKK